MSAGHTVGSRCGTQVLRLYRQHYPLPTILLFKVAFDFGGSEPLAKTLVYSVGTLGRERVSHAYGDCYRLRTAPLPLVGT